MQLTSFNRRKFIEAGAYSALAAAINSTPQSALGQKTNNPIRACILVMHYGGPSHLDTWDMKPQGPAEIRGAYQPISTNVPGRMICEHLPLMSQLVDKVALIRSLHHPMTNHNAAMYEALVGRLPDGGDNEILPADRAKDSPSYGSALTYLTEQGQFPRRDVPLTHVALPHVLHNVVDLAGQTAGFLGGRFDPLQVISDPNDPNFHIDALRLPKDISPQRLTERQQLLGNLNSLPADRGDPQVQAYRQRAFELLQNKQVQQAFNMNEEPASMRERYGRHKFGQSMLLARRLVESGVPFVNVNDKRVNGQVANWDSHETIFPRHQELLPVMDQGLSTLISDLDERGLLESTLVLSMGEFGRTPRINGSAGRDHWPFCYHAVLAGGGVRKGVTYGTSDHMGAYPIDQPVAPADLAATLFWRFGIDPTYEIQDAFGRPFPLATGTPLQDLFPNV